MHLLPNHRLRFFNLIGSLYTFLIKIQARICPTTLSMNVLRTNSQTIQPQNAIEGAHSRLVEKMLAFQKKRQSAPSKDDLDRVRNLEREIVRVDEEVDKRVYVLYGLTEEEIKIVEG